MTQRLFIALSLCLFIPASAADSVNQPQKTAQAALLVPPLSAPIAIPKDTNYDPNKKVPNYGLEGACYGSSPRVTPGSTPVGTPPRQSIKN